MGAPDLYRHPTRSEIIELAAAEGHDADIPSNAGSIKLVPSRRLTSGSLKFDDPEKSSALGKDKDIEKGDFAESISIQDEAAESNDDDPNIVSWDGPDDPQNPLNWSYTKKWGTVALVSALTFTTPLASSIIAPGVPKIMETFNSTDDMIEQFMVSIYVLGFAFGPMSECSRRSWYTGAYKSSRCAVVRDVRSTATIP